MKYKICWITLCKNEEDLIPFCIDYWKRIADKVVVFDNHSTDSSVELLSKHDWIEVRYFDSDGQNDVIQKQIKEQAYLEYKDQFDVIIISDMDELFFMNDVESKISDFLLAGYNIMAFPIYSLCEDYKPNYNASMLLHQMSHKFYKQRMNHMDGFDEISKLSIFNCHTTDKVMMSVGQHYVQTLPSMRIMLVNDGFCLHVDKGWGVDYKYKIRQKMWENLSDVNKNGGMCLEYSDSYEKLKQEYENNQKKSFDINERFNSHNKS
jgi:hypothetical protein